MSHATRFSLAALLCGRGQYRGRVKGANGRTKSIPEGYDGKFVNPKKQTHGNIAVEKVED